MHPHKINRLRVRLTYAHAAQEKKHSSPLTAKLQSSCSSGAAYFKAIPFSATAAITTCNTTGSKMNVLQHPAVPTALWQVTQLALPQDSRMTLKNVVVPTCSSLGLPLIALKFGISQVWGEATLPNTWLPPYQLAVLECKTSAQNHCTSRLPRPCRGGCVADLKRSGWMKMVIIESFVIFQSLTIQTVPK